MGFIKTLIKTWIENIKCRHTWTIWYDIMGLPFRHCLKCGAIQRDYHPTDKILNYFVNRDRVREIYVWKKINAPDQLKYEL